MGETVIRGNMTVLLDKDDGSVTIDMDGPPRGQLRVWPGETVDKPASVRLTLNEGFTSSDLRRFPWKRWLTVADAAMRGLDDRADPATSDHLSAVLLAVARNERKIPKAPSPIKIERRPGRKGHPDAHYRRVAERYQQLYSSGVHNPTTTISKEYGQSRDTAADWVRGARDRGYLPPARKGRAG